MALEPTPTNSPAAPAAQPASPQPVPAASAPSLLGAEPSTPIAPAGGEQPPAAVDDKAAAESAARVDGWAKAEGKAAKITAWQGLTKAERAEAFKALDETARKELGIESADAAVYNDFKLPEGFVVDDKEMGEFVGMAKENGLSQEGAQKMLDMGLAREKAAANAGVQAYQDLQTKWHGEVMADPEIGGTKWTATIASIDALMGKLNIPGLKEAMNLTGAGNNPAIVKAFARLAAMAKEDRIHTGAAAPSANSNRAPNYYGDAPKGSDA